MNRFLFFFVVVLLLTLCVGDSWWFALTCLNWLGLVYLEKEARRGPVHRSALYLIWRYNILSYKRPRQRVQYVSAQSQKNIRQRNEYQLIHVSKDRYPSSMYSYACTIKLWRYGYEISFNKPWTGWYLCYISTHSTKDGHSFHMIVFGTKNIICQHRINIVFASDRHLPVAIYLNFRYW